MSNRSKGRSKGRSKRKNKSKTKNISKRSRKTSSKIKDPPFLNTIHKGTAASKGSIVYEYQDYSNIMDTLEIILENNQLSKYVHLFKKDPVNAFITIDLHRQQRIYPEYMKLKDFIKELRSYVYRYKKGGKYLIPLILNIRYTKKENHANMILMNIQNQTVELFEPHGNRLSDSVIGGIEGGYKKKTVFVREFFHKHFPEFKVINVNRSLHGRSFQVLHDPREHSGYCVTWCLLYTHYRILNPNVSIDKLIGYMDKKINTNLLLRYASYSEHLLKD